LYYFRFIFDVFPLHIFFFCSATILYFAGVLLIVGFKRAFAFTVLIEITDVSGTISVPIVMLRCDIGSKLFPLYTKTWLAMETNRWPMGDPVSRHTLMMETEIVPETWII
jgi:hypothetical protein